jgi:hypothetical protein
VLAQGCTTIGRHRPEVLETMNFGPPEEVRFCVLLDADISQTYAEKLLAAWNTDEGKNYNLFVRPVSFENHKRGGFTARGILEDLVKVPLGDGCDRIIFFVGRDYRDTLLWAAGLFVPLPTVEVRGAVDDSTGTHGFVVAALAHPDDLLNDMFFSREKVTVHELYHFLGCPHGYIMDECYESIRQLKETYRTLKAQGFYKTIGEPSFFPSRNLKTFTMVQTRAAVNAVLNGPGNTTGDEPSAQEDEQLSPRRSE